jgi:hypothetical protein
VKKPSLKSQALDAAVSLYQNGAKDTTVTEVMAEGKIPSSKRAAVRRCLSWVAIQLAVQHGIHVNTVNGLWWDKNERDNRLDPELARRYLPYGNRTRVYGLKLCSGDDDAIWKASQEIQIYNGCSKVACQMQKMRVALEDGTIKLQSATAMLQDGSAFMREQRVGKRRFALMRNGTEMGHVGPE